MSVELGGLLGVIVALLVQGGGIVWWGSKMTQRQDGHTDALNKHSTEIKELYVLHGQNKDKIYANEEAALNREIEYLKSENARLREGK